jgi:hypothetical protein
MNSSDGQLDKGVVQLKISTSWLAFIRRTSEGGEIGPARIYKNSTEAPAL